jgi:precorrin-6B methylase 2
MNVSCRESRALAGLLLCFSGVAFAQAPAQSPAAKSGINDTWKSPDIDPLVARLETESREIYHERAKLAALVAPKPGSAIADVGAGSGFMVEEFAKLVGGKGKVYAVDINAKMMEHVAQRARQLGLPQIQTVVTHEDSVDLPPASVDIVFVCDTYHHFEYPQKSLAGIRNALRAGGELVVVDFNRVPGKTSAQMMEHVRASKEEVVKEIIAAGFTLVADQPAPFLSDNYVIRFRRK